MKRVKARTGTILSDIVYKTDNIIVQGLRWGCSSDVVVIGTGDYTDVEKLDEESSYYFEHYEIKSKRFMDYIPYDLLNYIDNKVTVYSIYFDYNSKGLEEASNDIVKWVEKETEFLKDLRGNIVQNITFIGMSKAAVCFYSSVSKLPKSPMRNISLYTVASPFKGTLICSDDIYKQPKRFGKFLNFVHKKVFNGVNVEKDLDPKSEFIKSLKKINLNSSSIQHLNLVTKVTRKSCHNIRDWILLWINWALGWEGDGIVPCNSQNLDDVYTYIICTSHDSALRTAMKILKENREI